MATSPETVTAERARLAILGVAIQDLDVEEAVAACEGDARAAVAALLVTLDATERELEALKVEVAKIEAAVSGGYVRKNLKRREP